MRSQDQLQIIEHEEAVPTYQEMVSIVTDPHRDLRDRALLAALYLSNSRVSEIVKPYLLRNDQLVMGTHKHKRFLIFQNLHTQKNRKHPLRNVPVRIDKDKEIINVLLEYSKTLPETAPLFEITRQRAWQIISAMTGKYCHWFRHTRDTHLYVDRQMKGVHVAKLNGWTDLRPLSRYAHLLWRNVADEM